MELRVRVLSGALLLAAIAGCASIKSKSDLGAEGLRYYMPVGTIKITLTVSEHKPEKGDSYLVSDVAVTVLDPVADLSKGYVLQFSRSWVGQSKMSMAISEQGLLHGDSVGFTKPGIGELLEGIAGKPPVASSERGTACKEAGTYEWVILAKRGSQTLDRCGLEVTIAPLTLDKEWGTQAEVVPAKHFGVFYRLRQPVEITVIAPPVSTEDDELSRAFLGALPLPESDIGFLPIPQAAFADVDWKLKFNHGSPTLYEIETGGEVQGLVSLPAQVLQAYADALTHNFTRADAISGAEASHLAAVAALAAQQAAYARCMEVVASSDDHAAIQAACATK